MLHRYHELSGGGQLLATLRWLKVFGSLAKVESREGNFTLKRGGFVMPYVSVRDAAFDTDFAVLNMNLISGGRLSFSDGHEFTFASLRFWNYDWSFKDESGAVVFSIRRRSSLKQCGDVVISPKAKRDKHLLVAIAAAWYAIVIASEETAATSAGAS
ncbi:MAG: hypothetical protein A3K60_04365 [Euryarchaeota archaeon RBG_19FT_COMBO_56_21]|nr:MAG: hypothetical protein A3K60_04365 [Euryarchaeota archaeon RBG_19FT_COMBO_56_21]